MGKKGKKNEQVENSRIRKVNFNLNRVSNHALSRFVSTKSRLITEARVIVNQAGRRRSRVPKLKLKIIYELISANAKRTRERMRERERERERERGRVNEACQRLSIASTAPLRVAPEDRARRGAARDSRDTPREGSALLSEFQRNVKLRITQAITLLG